MIQYVEQFSHLTCMGKIAPAVTCRLTRKSNCLRPQNSRVWYFNMKVNVSFFDFFSHHDSDQLMRRVQDGHAPSQEPVVPKLESGPFNELMPMYIIENWSFKF